MIITMMGVFVAVFAAAQPGQGPRTAKPGNAGRDGWHGGTSPEVRELLEQVMMARLSRKLELSDEETVLLVRKFSEYRERMREMNQQRRELLRIVEQKVRTGADDTQVQAALGRLRAHDKAMAGLQQAVFDEAAASLTAAQQAKLYVFLGDFEQEVQRLIQQARERFRSGHLPPGRQGRFGSPRGPMPEGPPAQETERRPMRPDMQPPAPPPAPGDEVPPPPDASRE